MAATPTLAQASTLRKSVEVIPQPNDINSVSIRPRRGVIVLYGYGTNVRVERGHLVIEDGVGSDRYKVRLSRV
jgi:hypothetical protein